mmetsp:Transcript_54790/g.130675  ORF Transcript_54790/g.130675 Transcript_54790/m.130675 type:complete len:219 (-) Transcript_54790:707-1363(-)
MTVHLVVFHHSRWISELSIGYDPSKECQPNKNVDQLEEHFDQRNNQHTRDVLHCFTGCLQHCKRSLHRQAEARHPEGQEDEEACEDASNKPHPVHSICLIAHQVLFLQTSHYAGAIGPLLPVVEHTVVVQEAFSCHLVTASNEEAVQGHHSTDGQQECKDAPCYDGGKLLHQENVHIPGCDGDDQQYEEQWPCCSQICTHIHHLNDEVCDSLVLKPLL